MQWDRVRNGAALLLFLATVFLSAAAAHAEEDLAALLAESTPLERCIIAVESHGDPNAIGDGGTSYGLVQIHRYGGEWARFWAAGFTDLFDARQSRDFLRQEIAAGRGPAWTGSWWKCA